MILVNARAAARPELGGVERWARELSARLPREHPGRYSVARPPQALSHRAGHAWEQLALPLLARRARAELVLCPANLAPLTGVRTAVVVHDAAALHHPEWYSPLYARWQRLVLPRIVAGAERLITVSAFSRDELVAHAGADPATVVVVPGGVDHTRMYPGADAEAARAAHGLGDRPYVLTVASRTARKNLEALDIAARRLAVVGVNLFAAGGDRPQLNGGDGLPPGVRSLGHVDDRLLGGLYAGAAAFVLPSRHEGFGLPCLEAMACGTPVVTTTAGALPQTCGDAALYADPDDAVGLAAQLGRLVEDPALHADLRARGLQHAAQFSWGRTAREVDAALTARTRG
ncbi:MAG: glycosyltransferase family 4 protein [Solirubrobacterales bacterium]|nr:glycosyltransferase family 4 protein [Solirubrobacterales bacterium]